MQIQSLCARSRSPKMPCIRLLVYLYTVHCEYRLVYISLTLTIVLVGNVSGKGMVVPPIAMSHQHFSWRESEMHRVVRLVQPLGHHLWQTASHVVLSLFWFWREWKVVIGELLPVIFTCKPCYPVQSPHRNSHHVCREDIESNIMLSWSGLEKEGRGCPTS